MERRAFLLTTAASTARAPGANERIRGAVIGAGGRGKLLTASFKELGVEMAAVCDVYEPNLEGGLKAASTGAKPYRNYKQMLEDKSIDAVVIATPDHWHAQMAIDAVEAGKDVYVEKPMAHTIEDSFRMVEAVRRTRRVLQVGTQRHSYDLFIEAKQIIDTAPIGEIRLV
ncbi:MAG: Gfo/Idh/MocA family oxidoreductase, partial [Acidobacteriota bacterium]